MAGNIARGTLEKPLQGGPIRRQLIFHAGQRKKSCLPLLRMMALPDHAHSWLLFGLHGVVALPELVQQLLFLLWREIFYQADGFWQQDIRDGQEIKFSFCCFYNK